MSSVESRVEIQIEEHLRGKEPRLREVVEGVRALVRETVPDVAETVNPWGVPTFDFKGPMCYLSVASKHVTFGFYRGTSLDDPTSLLEGVGKNLRHVKVRKVEDLKNDGLRVLVRAAARLNETEPLDGMGRPRRTHEAEKSVQ